MAGAGGAVGTGGGAELCGTGVAAALFATGLGAGALATAAKLTKTRERFLERLYEVDAGKAEELRKLR